MDGKTMKYQYKILNVEMSQVTEAALNNLGNQGWQLVLAFIQGTKIFAVFMRG